jgi:predicted dehydrogenase
MSIRWAIVSTGKHADTLVAPAIRAPEGAQLVAVYREHGRAAAFATKHGAEVAYTSLEALVQDTRVDVVYIVSPSFLHAPYTAMAAQAGKHVLVEKPMAVGVDEAVAMVRTCRWHGVQLAVGFHLRHHPGHQEARRLIAEGVLGTVPLAQAQWGAGLRGHAAIPCEVFMEARSGPQSA